MTVSVAIRQNKVQNSNQVEIKKTGLEVLKKVLNSAEAFQLTKFIIVQILADNYFLTFFELTQESKWREDNERLKQSWQRLRVSGEDKKMLEGRRKLPAWTLREQIMKTIRENQVPKYFIGLSEFWKICS